MKHHDSLMQWFLSHCSQKILPAKSLLFSHARQPTRLCYLISGQAYLLAQTRSNKPRILQQLNSGSFVGIEPLFSQQKNYDFLEEAWCIRTRLSENKVAFLPYDQFLLLAKQAPELWFRIAHQQTQHEKQLRLRLMKQLSLDVTERILDRISFLAHSREAVTHPKGIQIYSTRQELSQWAGCSRETVGRVLKLLQEQERITAKGKTILFLR